MSFSIKDLDVDFQLSLFAAILEMMSGLVALREQQSGRLVYINETGMRMLGTDNPVEQEAILERYHLGYSDKIIEKAPHSVLREERQWTNYKGETFTGTCETLLFSYAGKEYCVSRIADGYSDNRYQQEINKELQRFDVLFDYASIGILIANKEGDIVMVNDYALEQFGYKRAEVLRQKVEMLIPERVHHKHGIHRRRFNDNPQNRPMGTGLSLFAIRKDGSEFPVEISLSHYQNEEGEFVIAYVNDITERKKAEAKNEELNNELEQMVEERTRQLRKALEDLELSKEELTVALSREKDLSELKTRFVSMASHEFRTPLSTVLSSAFLVKQYGGEEDQPKRNKHIQRIVSSVNLLTDILNDFLSVGKIEEGKIQVRLINLDIVEHINSVIEEMQGLIKEKQQINYQHAGTSEVVLDPSLLKHIVMNLLGNAIKFSGKGATISIHTSKDEDQFLLQVKDNGIGMSEEDQQHLFERFYRGANVSNIQGTGLGLHIVNKYSELMNGQIFCDSELGTGTTFTIVFSLNNNVATY
jgi:PAS domain S-box-containing protein